MLVLLLCVLLCTTTLSYGTPIDSRGGEALELPSALTENMSFLEGCWLTDPYMSYNWTTGAQHPIQTRFCFRQNGKGKRFVYDKGEIYKGPVTVRVHSRGIRIQTSRAYSAAGTSYTPITIDCEGFGRATLCRDYCVNPQNSQHVHRRTIVLRKESDPEQERKKQELARERERLKREREYRQPQQEENEQQLHRILQEATSF